MRYLKGAKLGLTSAVGAALIALTPASASPLGNYGTQLVVPESAVEQAQLKKKWKHKRKFHRKHTRSFHNKFGRKHHRKFSRHGHRKRFRFHRHHHHDFWHAVPFALSLALPLIAQQSGSAHVRWCYNRYRSYDARTNTFMGYDGRRHYCNSPYD